MLTQHAVPTPVKEFMFISAADEDFLNPKSDVASIKSCVYIRCLFPHYFPSTLFHCSTIELRFLITATFR
jgi:hypothetical protein